MDPLALAGGFPFQQSKHNALGGKDPGGQVRHRNTNAHRAFIGSASDGHKAAHTCAI